MTDQDESGASDETEQTEQNVEVKEQTTDYADTLLALAREEEGLKGEAEPETLEDEVPATEPETEDDQEVADPEVEKPEAKKGDEWPSSAKERVAEETAKRKRANERADIAHAEVERLRAQLQQNLAPKPTEDDPFKDVLDPNALDRFEASYEKAIELADEYPAEQYPDGVEGVVVGKNPDGTDKTATFTADKLREIKRKAEKAIRKFIPERRSYLQQRAVADQRAAEIYPELKDPDSDFTKAVATLAQSLMTGQAMKAPDILEWIGHAVKGYQMKIQENGHGKAAKVKSPEAKKIVHAAQTKIAPTPTRSRSFVERGTRSVTMDKAAKTFAERGDDDSAEELIGAIFANSRGSKRLEPMGN